MSKTFKKIAVIAVLLFPLSFPIYAHAGFYDWLVSRDNSNDVLVRTSEETRPSFDNFYRWAKSIEEAPQEEPRIKYKIVRESFRQVTAYNVGDPYQTDSTPCTGAYSSVNLCEEIEKGTNVCAANFVPLGTMLRIGSGEDSFECIVWDRMNSRYTSRVDIAMSRSEKAQARQFGLQKLTVQILKEVETGVSI